MITKAGTINGQDVHEALLEDGDVSLRILSFGAVTRDWRVGKTPVVLGFRDIETYNRKSNSAGAICGRVANRIKDGRFSLDGQSYQLELNDGKNSSHGGFSGLSHQNWKMEADSANRAVRLSYASEDGEGGYPGAVAFDVTVRLDGHQVSYEMRGMPDRATPINLVQHNYYVLGSSGVLNHHITMPASKYTIVDEGLVPTGAFGAVSGTHMDFRSGAEIGAIDPALLGIDINYVLDSDRDVSAPAVVARSDETRLTLKLWTDEPGVQVYNASRMSNPAANWHGERYDAFAGICFEPQHFANALNIREFPPIISTPENPYVQDLKVEIRREN